MAIIPKSVQTIVNDPKVASAIQRKLQSQVSAIERKVQSADASLKTSKEPGFDSSKEIQRFKSQYQNLVRAINELSDVPDKIARSLNKLSKSFLDIRKIEQQIKQERYWSPKRNFSSAAGRLESDMMSGNRMGIKSGYEALKGYADSSKGSLKELSSISSSDKELVGLMKQLVSQQAKAVSGYGSRLAASETTVLAGGRGATNVFGGATGRLAAGFYNRYGITPASVRETTELAGGRGATGAFGGSRTGPIPPSYYARMGIIPTPSRETTAFPSAASTGFIAPGAIGAATRPMTIRGGYGGPSAGPLAYPSTAPTVPLPGSPLPPIIPPMGGGTPKWVKNIEMAELARYAYRIADRAIDKGDEAYINTFDVSRKIGSDVGYDYARGLSKDSVSGMGMRDLTNLMAGNPKGQVGEVNKYLLSQGYNTKDALELMSGYGRFGGLRTASSTAAAFSRDRTAGFMSGSEWTQFAGRLADIGLASDISPAGLNSSSIASNLDLARQFVGSLGAATGTRNFSKDTAMTIYNNALDLSSRGNIGNTTGLANFTSGLAVNSGLSALRSPEGIASSLGSLQNVQTDMWQRPVMMNMMLQMFHQATGSDKGTVANWRKFVVGMGGSSGDLDKYLPIMKDWEKENLPNFLQMQSLGMMKAFPPQMLGKGFANRFRKDPLLKSLAPLLMGSSSMMGSDYANAAYSSTYFPGSGMLGIPISPSDPLEKTTTDIRERHATKDSSETVGAAISSGDAAGFLHKLVDYGAAAVDELKKLNDRANLPYPGTPAPASLGAMSMKEIEEFYKKHGYTP